MNTVLIILAFVIILINFAICVGSFSYISKMNKHMNEWFKMFKDLVNISSRMNEDNRNLIDLLKEYIDCAGENMKIVRDLDDNYNKLYNETKEFEKRVGINLSCMYEKIMEDIASKEYPGKKIDEDNKSDDNEETLL